MIFYTCILHLRSAGFYSHVKKAGRFLFSFAILIVHAGKLQRVTFLHELISSDTIDKTVHSIVDDWNSLGQLYAATLKFADVYKSE